MDLYTRAQEDYGEVIMPLVEKCMMMEFKTSEALTIIESSRDTEDQLSRAATLTDSYISDMDKLDQTLQDNSFSSGSSFTKILKRKKNKKWSIIFSVLFVTLLVGFGWITLQHLNPAPPVCDYAEYYNKDDKRCESCSVGCERC